jgi:alpha-amylase
MVAYGDWLTRSLDLQGYRIDDTKGMAVAFVRDWMTARSMGSRFCVSEYFDGDPGALNWWVHDSGMGGRSAVFDFTLHFKLQAMCDDGNFDMTGMHGAGYAARDPLNAVTFVDNPDTDLSPGEQIIGSKLLAYAFILTTEGYPFVYHKDYAEEPGCYRLKKWIDNLVWIHENLANGSTTTRWNDPRVIVTERLGEPGLLTAINTDVWNQRTVTCQTAFGANAHLKDYTGRHGDVWTDGGGRVTFTIPSNAFSGGQSYLCFSRTGHDRAMPLRERHTVQTFFGADDLDIPAIPANAAVVAGRVWCAAHKPLRASLRAEGPHAGGQVLVEVAGPGGAVAAGSPSGANGSTLELVTTEPGWYQLHVIGQGRSAAAAYELEVTYTGTPDFALP